MVWLRRNSLVAALLAAVMGLMWWIASVEAPETQAETEQDVDGAFEVSVQGASDRPLQPDTAPAPLQPSAAPLAPQPPAAEPVAPPVDAPPRQGPIDELSSRFEREPRDSGAHDIEQSVRAAFSRDSVAPELFKSVLCRQSVCKVVVRITPQRMPGYIQAVTELVSNEFDADFAVDPAPEIDADQMRSVEVYLQRRERARM